jgi:hypothetical protein
MFDRKKSGNQNTRKKKYLNDGNNTNNNKVKLKKINTIKN